jgi:hypothetical protein
MFECLIKPCSSDCVNVFPPLITNTVEDIPTDLCVILGLVRDPSEASPKAPNKKDDTSH